MTTNAVSTASLSDQIAYLQTSGAIRERCDRLFERACAGNSAYFRVDLERLPSVADYVLHMIQTAYPTLEVPFHSRWRHFEVDGGKRLTHLEAGLAVASPLERAKAKFDLVILSVLLDAGAGATWQYADPLTGESWGRSEGLALASFDLFCQGQFSSTATLLQADAIALTALTEEQLAQGFQVTGTNPLVGLAGRAQLLQRLGKVMQQQPQRFHPDRPRPGDLVDYLVQQADRDHLPASHVLQAVLTSLGNIWPGRFCLHGVNLGDVWLHSGLGGTQPFDNLVPFHKLSQWLTYSLLEPLQELGLTITELDELTGLPEYRNGGLCLDLGLIYLTDATLAQVPHPPDSELIVEWRALTVACLDRIAATLRQTLNQSATEFPLVKVLQGGTWTAGRAIAATLRPGGTPPLQIVSDGTVF
jgi:hypothetical protein